MIGKPQRYQIWGWGWGVNQDNHAGQPWQLLEIVFSLEEAAKECQVTLHMAKKALNNKTRIANTYLEIIPKW